MACYRDSLIKKVEISEICSMNGRMEDFVRRKHLGDVDIDGSIILEWVIRD
jgi:hypothetical protein